MILFSWCLHPHPTAVLLHYPASGTVPMSTPFVGTAHAYGLMPGIRLCRPEFHRTASSNNLWGKSYTAPVGEVSHIGELPSIGAHRPSDHRPSDQQQGSRQAGGEPNSRPEERRASGGSGLIAIKLASAERASRLARAQLREACQMPDDWQPSRVLDAFRSTTGNAAHCPQAGRAQGLPGGRRKNSSPASFADATTMSGSGLSPAPTPPRLPCLQKVSPIPGHVLPSTATVETSQGTRDHSMINSVGTFRVGDDPTVIPVYSTQPGARTFRQHLKSNLW